MTSTHRLSIALHFRFDRKYHVNAVTGCWVWDGGTEAKGRYGKFWVDGRYVRAHRWSYERHAGPIPPGMTLDHLCEQTLCVNPEHLEPLPIRDNQLRSHRSLATNAYKTHCKRGHPFNSRITVAVPQGRMCRVCSEASRKASAARRRGQDDKLEDWLDRVEARYASALALPPDPAPESRDVEAGVA